MVTEKTAIPAAAVSKTTTTKKTTALVDFPEELHDYFSADQSSLLKTLSEAAPGVAVEVQPDSRSLLVSSSQPHSVQTVEKLAKEYVEHATAAIVPHLKMLDEAKRQFRPSVAYEEFAVPTSLMRLAIGSRGTNINNARGLDGVVVIDNKAAFAKSKGIQLFKVIAVDAKTAKAARDMLEFIKVPVPVPSAFVGRVIGKAGSVIQGIVDKSEVLRVNIDPETPNPGPDAHINFYFTGVRSAVEVAKAMVNLQVQLARDVEKIRSELSALKMELIRGSRQQKQAAATASSSSVAVAAGKSKSDEKAAPDSVVGSKPGDAKEKGGKPAGEKALPDSVVGNKPAGVKGGAAPSSKPADAKPADAKEKSGGSVSSKPSDAKEKTGAGKTIKKTSK